MQRIGFYAGRNRSDDLLHVETDGCIVNIRVGLTDNEGRQVTNVTVLPDDETRGGDGEGRIWRQDGARIIRLHEDETDADAAWPPVAGSGDPGYDEAAQQALEADGPAIPDRLALDDIAEMLRDPDWAGGMLEDIADIVRGTGRPVADYPDGRSTWNRH